MSCPWMEARTEHPRTRLRFGRFRCHLDSCGNVQAQGATPCVALDQTVTGRLKPLIERTDMHSTVLSGAVVRDLAWARLDCREGRYARAEANYRVLIDALDRNPTAEARASALAIRSRQLPSVSRRGAGGSPG